MSIDRDFEQWYAENAFDFERDPIGSRDCGLQRKAWHAAIARGKQQGREERDRELAGKEPYAYAVKSADGSEELMYPAAIHRYRMAQESDIVHALYAGPVIAATHEPVGEIVTEPFGDNQKDICVLKWRDGYRPTKGDKLYRSPMPAAVVSDGWKLMPKIATPTMIESARIAAKAANWQFAPGEGFNPPADTMERIILNAAFQALIDSAPAAPAQPKEGA